MATLVNYLGYNNIMSGIASVLILEQKAQLGYSSNNSSLEMKMVRLSDRYNGTSLYYSSVFVCFEWFIIKGFKKRQR